MDTKQAKHRDLSLQDEVFGYFKGKMFERELESLKKDGFYDESLREGIPFAEESAEALGIFSPVKKEEDSGFSICDINLTPVIKHLSSINGITLEELEKNMRPGKFSDDGFLGKDEKLLDVLIADNDFVLSQRLTHQELAYCLKYAAAIVESRHDFKEQHGYDSQDKDKFILNGRAFMVMEVPYLGYQDSPFKDGTSTNIDLMICNLHTGKALKASGLHAEMIERYGFYEGKGTSYRLEPTDIIEVFDFLKNS